MITVLRKNFGKRVFKVVAWITIVSVAGIFSLESLFRKKEKNAIATVDGTVIGYKEFALRAEAEAQRIQLMRQQFGDEADFILQLSGHSGNPQEYALNSLISEKLLNGLSDKLHLAISSDYVATKLNDQAFCMQVLGTLVPAYVFDGYGSLNQKALSLYLQRQGLTISDFEDEVLAAMKRLLSINLIATAAYVPACQVYNLFVQENSVKTFEILSLPLDKFIKAEEKKGASDEELKAFFDAQNNQLRRYFVNEKRSGVMWRVPFEAYGLKKEDAARFKKLFTSDARRIVDQETTVISEFLKEKHAREEKIALTIKKATPAIRNLFSISDTGMWGYFIDDQGGVLCQVLDIQKAHIPEFDVLKKDITLDFFKDKAQARLQEILRNGVEAVRQGTTQDFLKTSGAQSVVIDGNPKELEKLGISATRLQYMTHVGEALSLFTKHGGAVVILKSLEVQSKENFEVKKDELYASLFMKNAQLLTHSLVADLQKRAKIDIITEKDASTPHRTHRKL